MEKKDFLYEGKAKRVYTTEEADKIIVSYKDDATAFNAQKKGSIQNKGLLNNKISTLLFELLEKENIPTHFIKQLNDTEQLCKKVMIIPLEFVVRNRIAGSMAKRLDIEEGTIPTNQIIDICYKRDDLGDPLINNDHAVALGVITYEELDFVYSLTNKINDFLVPLFNSIGIILVDFKLEFGKTNDGEIILADEISPDTCRFWDKETLKKLDKDRFRRDLGSVEEAYQEIYERLSSAI